jgi:putative ABC transport system permease protein
MVPASIGVALGLLIAASLTRVMQTLLFQVDAFDPITFLLIPVFLLAVSALACYLPALRATRVDPTIALRTE